MRFDLVDLQLFIAVADSRSITRGADRSHLALASASARIKGLEEALGVALFKRGRRGVELTAAGESLLDHARLVIHNVDAMRGDLARFARGREARTCFCSPTPRACRNICRRRWRASCASIPRSMSTSRSTKAPRSRPRLRAAPPISALPPSTRCPTIIERFTFSEDRLTLVTAKKGPFAARRQIDFHEVAASDFVGLTNATALQAHISPACGAARHPPACPRAAARFRRDLPDGRRRRRRRRDAGSRGQTLRARRCRSRRCASAIAGPTASS